MPPSPAGSLSARARAAAFCTRFGLRAPILMAPMAGACPPALAAAVANGGGMGAMGALLNDPASIAAWAAAFRAHSNGAFQLNLWIPDPPPIRDPAAETRVRETLARFGPEVPPTAGDTPLQDFDAQLAALLEARPHAVSSIMGLFPLLPSPSSNASASPGSPAPPPWPKPAKPKPPAPTPSSPRASKPAATAAASPPKPPNSNWSA